jgi:hypothetical protein
MKNYGLTTTYVTWMNHCSWMKLLIHNFALAIDVNEM